MRVCVYSRYGILYYYIISPPLSISLGFPTDEMASSLFLEGMAFFVLEGNCSELCTYVYGSTHSILFPIFFAAATCTRAFSRRGEVANAVVIVVSPSSRLLLLYATSSASLNNYNY